MNPQFDPTPGLRLPEPSLDPRSAAPAVQQPLPPQQPMMGQQPQQFAQPTMAPVAQPLPQQPMMPVAPQPVDQSQPASASDPIDENAMDDAWVTRAKAAVEQFSTDPYSESNALSKLKAEYLKSRHNITTKLGDNHES